jgi:hypothetical protein
MGPMAGRRISPAVMICSPLNNIPRHYTFAITTVSAFGFELYCPAHVRSVRSVFCGGEAALAQDGLFFGGSPSVVAFAFRGLVWPSISALSKQRNALLSRSQQRALVRALKILPRL